MKVITKAELVRNVVEEWKEVYFDQYGRWQYQDKEDIYNRLLTATTENEITEIIGNDGWTQNKCDECNQDREMTIELGDGCGEYNPERFCAECLRKALAELERQ